MVGTSNYFLTFFLLSFFLSFFLISYSEISILSADYNDGTSEPFHIVCTTKWKRFFLEKHILECLLGSPLHLPDDVNGAPR